MRVADREGLEAVSRGGRSRAVLKWRPKTRPKPRCR